MKKNAMKILGCVLTLSVVTQSPLYAGSKDDKAACESVKKKIRAIEAKMRDGFTAAQGIRYDARLRELKDERYKRCRS